MPPAPFSLYRRVALALAIGLWVYLFLVFIAPFDLAPVGLDYRAMLGLGYGLIIAFVHLVVDWVLSIHTRTNALGRRVRPWVFTGVFFATVLLPVYGYYRSGIVLGEFTFLPFLLQVYLPVFLILIPPLALGHWLLHPGPVAASEKIAIRGDNRNDLLQLKTADLLYVKAAQNYVEVHFLLLGAHRKKMIRTTLRKVLDDLPELVRTHRSYLINPANVAGLAEDGSIMMGRDLVPVSGTYRSSVDDRLKSRP